VLCGPHQCGGHRGGVGRVQPQDLAQADGFSGGQGQGDVEDGHLGGGGGQPAGANLEQALPVDGGDLLAVGVVARFEVAAEVVPAQPGVVADEQLDGGRVIAASVSPGAQFLVQVGVTQRDSSLDRCG